MEIDSRVRSVAHELCDVNLISKLIEAIPYLHKSHNAPLFPTKILHNHCLRFLLGHKDAPGT